MEIFQREQLARRGGVQCDSSGAPIAYCPLRFALSVSFDSGHRGLPLGRRQLFLNLPIAWLPVQFLTELHSGASQITARFENRTSH